MNAAENDPLCIFTEITELVDDLVRPLPLPVCRGAVDAAIELFALLFPLQNSIVQESTLEALVKTVKTAKGLISRRNTFSLNAMTAVVGALCYIMMKKGALASDRVTAAIRDLVYVCAYLFMSRILFLIHIL